MLITLEQLKATDQITRYCLIGSGIIHGLEVFVNEDGYITVSSGVGLTSDGTYIEHSTNKAFSFYKESTADASWTSYLGLHTWQLLEKYHPDAKPLKPQNAQQAINPFLMEKVLVMYQNTASPESTSLVFLLVNQAELLKKLELNKIAIHILWSRLRDDEDYISSDAYVRERLSVKDLNQTVNPALRLHEIPLLRFGFAPGNPFVCPPMGEDKSAFPEVQSLNAIYTGDAATATSGYEDVINKAIVPLDKALRELVKLFSPILGEREGWNKEQVIDLLQDKWAAYKKKNEGATPKKEYVQYFYDWVRDLLQAYNELRQLLIDLVADTFPNTNEHPKHLLLGLTIKGNVVNVPSPLRHHFVQPPIYNGNAARLEQVKLYFWRILTMIKGFYLPDYLPSNRLKDCNIGMSDGKIDLDYNPIKITPSKFYHHPLAAQSIPFYYTVYDHPFSVHRYWNYQRTKTSTEDYLLSYHANDLEDGYTEVPQAIHPLHYNLDEFEFYRIEGHIGRLIDFYEEKKDATGVISGIGYFININGGKVEFISDKSADKSALEKYFDYLIQKYNLDFEVKFIEIKPGAAAAIKATQEFSATASFQDKSTKTVTENNWSRTKHLLGMEHIAGVKKGGTLIVVYEARGDKNIAIADFSLPYRLSMFK